MKILIVDDSRAMRMILRQILREIGFEDVSEAGHGLEALVHLDRHPDTALALIDWNMPEMNGLELLTALQQDSRFDSMRRMMVTTESEMPQIVKAIGAGASEYVMKPFTRDAIKEKLRLIGLAA
jgi:two-component system, chemotaxis family, chemotaxis protein CheY